MKIKCNHPRHGECYKIYDIGEFGTCPMCGYQVYLHTPMTWCANCYTIWKRIGDYIHFSESFEPTEAQAIAIAMAKCGGISLSVEDFEEL